MSAIQRSRKGCLTCRGRKVKCDETPGTCQRCDDLSLECRWIESMETDVRVKGMACQACRQAKARCNRTRPICSRCNTHSIQCVYATQATLAIPRPSAPTPRDLESVLDAYFTFVHPIGACAYVHRGELMRDALTGSVPSLLIASIQVVTARFLPTADRNHLDGGSETAKLLQDVKSSLVADTERYSTTKLAALLNIIQHEANCGRHGSSWLLVSLAGRMAMAMGFNSENNDMSLTWVEKETRRRLLWGAFLVDSMSSGGIPEYTLLPRKYVRIALPCSERNYALAIPILGRYIGDIEFDEAPAPDGYDGVLQRLIRLVYIRNDLLEYTKHIANFEGRAWEQGSHFDLISRRLRCWRASLPPDLMFTVNNIYARKATPGELYAFAHIHLFYEQLHCTLYRLALPGFEESAPLDYLAAAPPGWQERLQSGCYARACEVRQKIRTLVRHAPNVVPPGDFLDTIVYENLRNQLAYLRYIFPGGEPQPAYNETVAGFEELLNVVGKRTEYVANARRTVRELLRMLARHGYNIQSVWSTHDSETAAPTPGQGVILPKAPNLQSRLRHPNLEQHRAQEPDGEQGLDPVTEEPLSASPAHGSQYSHVQEPLVDPLFDLFTDFDSFSGTFNPNQLHIPGMEGVPFTFDSLWTAQTAEDRLA